MNAQLISPLPTFQTQAQARPASVLQAVSSQPQAGQRVVKAFRLRGGYAGDSTRSVSLNRSIRGRYA